MAVERFLLCDGRDNDSIENEKTEKLSASNAIIFLVYFSFFARFFIRRGKIAVLQEQTFQRERERERGRKVGPTRSGRMGI